MEEQLPIIEVTGDNFHQVLPSIVKAVKDATFVAIDCELSGLGDRSKNNYAELDIRYQNMVETAHKYAVIALGLSCFSCNSVSSLTVQSDSGCGEVHSHDYIVQTFNVLTLCTDAFTVEYKALKFLHNHGFDFNKLYDKGVLYYKGCDRKNDEAVSVRDLFSAVLAHRKPLVVHNGLLDLIFLYQSFYCDLPKNNDTFAADLDDLYPQGIYDTKYLAEFHQMMPASYLEYLFKKMQLKNARRLREGEWHVRVRFPPYPRSSPNIEWHPYLQILSYKLDDDDDSRELCKMFAFHGFCIKSENCTDSHNVNKVVKVLQNSGAKKHGDSKYKHPRNVSLVQIIENTRTNENGTRKRKCPTPERKARVKKLNSTPEGPGDPLNVTATEEDQDSSVEGKTEDFKTNGHRAGYDAFMTAFIFASYISQKGKWTSKDIPFTPENIGLSDQVNKVYLMGKNIPFLIRTGAYASKSSNHCSKIGKIRKG